MFTFIVATLFFGVFLFAVSIMAWMFLLYHDKMVAALQFQPMPEHSKVYHVRIYRPRFVRPSASTMSPAVALAR